MSAEAALCATTKVIKALGQWRMPKGAETNTPSHLRVGAGLADRQACRTKGLPAAGGAARRKRR